MHDTHRGQGKAKLLKAIQLEKLREQGFNFATCTTAGDNVRQHRVLEGVGWRRLAESANSHSGGATVIWGWEVTE